MSLDATSAPHAIARQLPQNIHAPAVYVSPVGSLCELSLLICGTGAWGRINRRSMDVLRKLPGNGMWRRGSVEAHNLLWIFLVIPLTM